MNIRALLFPAAPETPGSFGLLLLRGFAGVSMATHGWGKMQNPFHWMDKAAEPAPAVFQALAAIAEFFGGMGLAVGALSVIAGFGVACTMLVAIQTHLGKGDPVGKWELAALYLGISVLVMLGGPGRFSVDALIRARLDLGKSGSD